MQLLLVVAEYSFCCPFQRRKKIAAAVVRKYCTLQLLQPEQKIRMPFPFSGVVESNCLFYHFRSYHNFAGKTWKLFPSWNISLGQTPREGPNRKTELEEIMD